MVANWNAGAGMPKMLRPFKNCPVWLINMCLFERKYNILNHYKLIK